MDINILHNYFCVVNYVDELKLVKTYFAQWFTPGGNVYEYMDGGETKYKDINSKMLFDRILGLRRALLHYLL